jgi:hypothetical protein
MKLLALFLVVFLLTSEKGLKVEGSKLQANLEASSI